MAAIVNDEQEIANNEQEINAHIENNEIENNEMREVVAPRTLETFLHPIRAPNPSCIMFPPNMPNYDFKLGMIQLLPIFHGMESENPYVHVREFEEAIGTFYNVQLDRINFIRLKFFPFSLKEKAKSWLYSLRARSIGSWGEMTQAFFNKYFPNHKTIALKQRISNFSQKENETLYQTWEKFKELLNLCPHHGFENWRLASYIYEGLLPRDRQFVESMCNGNFMQKDPDDALEFLDEIAEKAHQWTVPSLVETTDRSRIVTSSTNKGIYQLKEEDDWKLKFEVLTKEIAALKTEKSNLPQPVFQADVNQEIKGAYEERCATVGNFKQQYSPFSNTYNPATRNHPNFRWSNDSQYQTFFEQYSSSIYAGTTEAKSK
ncbi:uncharacterized protein LOC110746630, partial [Prunus avium]|uniref:Uncharacterized protein LOC110746630 n=1 Tax=Prunus avium TaxID=42229 RepID=A0A6P5RHW4_PRUAV